MELGCSFRLRSTAQQLPPAFIFGPTPERLINLHVYRHKKFILFDRDEANLRNRAGAAGGQLHQIQNLPRVLRKAVLLLNPPYPSPHSESQQKYAVDLAPQGSGNYEVEVSNMIEGRWNSVYFKQTKAPLEQVNIHKLAPAESTYSYCIRNIHGEKQTFNVSMQSGLELMEFELLPAKGDAENLERELHWLEKEKAKLFESLDRMESLRATSEGLTNLMSTKMVGFAIIGLLAIIVVNVLFYRELKKTFKERKLI